MGSTGDPNRLSPARRAAGRWRPRAGEEGAQGRSGRAAGRLPGSARFVPRAVPVTVPASGVAALYRLRKRPQRRTTPCRTCGDCWQPVRARPGTTISGTAAGGPLRGRGCLLHRHSARGTVARRLGRDPGSAQAARQREAIVLTSCLDLSPDLAAAAMRVSLATLRRRLADARSALRAVLPSNL